MITKAEVEKALRKLDRLSKTEYDSDLKSVLARPRRGDWDQDRATRQLGRLVGIEMKRPFARPRRLKTRSKKSHALREWRLKGEDLFERERRALRGTPEEKVLDILIKTYKTNHPERERTPYRIALDMHHEWGWLRELIVSVHPKLCGDKSLFKQLRNALGDAGARAPDLALAELVANILSQVLPGVPPTVLTGVSLLIIRQGASSFCRWAGRLAQSNRNLANEER